MKDITKKLHDDLKSGKAKVHTKTEDEKKRDAELLEEKKRKAFLSAAVLLGVTYNKLAELDELGATTGGVKYAMKNARLQAEKAINKMFDISDDVNGAVFIDEGSRHIEKLLEEYVP